MVITGIGKCTTISHYFEPPALLLEPEEALNAFSIQSMPLCFGVLAGHTGHAVDDWLGDQQPIVWRGAQHLMGVFVVSLPDTKGGALLGTEVKTGVYLVLAVGKIELHRGSLQ